MGIDRSRAPALRQPSWTAGCGCTGGTGARIPTVRICTYLFLLSDRPNRPSSYATPSGRRPAQVARPALLRPGDRLLDAVQTRSHAGPSAPWLPRGGAEKLERLHAAPPFSLTQRRRRSAVRAGGALHGWVRYVFVCPGWVDAGEAKPAAVPFGRVRALLTVDAVVVRAHLRHAARGARVRRGMRAPRADLHVRGHQRPGGVVVPQRPDGAGPGDPQVGRAPPRGPGRLAQRPRAPRHGGVRRGGVCARGHQHPGRREAGARGPLAPRPFLARVDAAVRRGRRWGARRALGARHGSVQRRAVCLRRRGGGASARGARRARAAQLL